MPQATHYDAIVIGSSRGGRLLPITLAKAGRKVALIERGHVALAEARPTKEGR
jgi:choline dehydrogenase-like flavoprotein